MAKSNDILPLLVLGFVAYKLFSKKDPDRHPPDPTLQNTSRAGIGRVTSWQEVNYRGEMRTCERGNWWERPICTPWQRQYS